MMQFGVQFFPALRPSDRDPAGYFGDCLAIAEEAESLGFTHGRTVEHYFEAYGGYSPNPIVFLSALSQRTKTMRLVTGAVLPVFNNPLKLAGEIAMLDAISGGRVEIGFARAFLPHEFRRFGISPDESRARFHEGLDQVDLLLTQEGASHRGQFHSFENVTSLPRPTQKPRPRFYIAATQTMESFEFAARRGYGLMTIPIGPIKPLVARYREVWRESGHPGDGEVMIAFHLFCDESGKRARDVARDPYYQYFRVMNESTRDWAEGKVQSKDYRDYDKSMSKMSESNFEDQIEKGSVWVGTPDEIRQNITRFIDFMGPFEHASLQINFGHMGYEDARRSMQLFASEVLPGFLPAHAAPPRKAQAG
jgi:alkanesulfonate monooxygenase SsuD/methylene tetrahydromethanopterin reductase-like flavin-dependent oxidoreductase (luciferase family)